MLDRIPSELLLQVADWVDGQRDLKHLCEVSKQLYTALLPRLYESITLNTKELSLKRLVTKLQSVPTPALQHTKHVALRAPFHGLLSGRCPHNRFPVFTDMGATGIPPSKDVSDLPDPLRSLRNAVGSFLASIPKNNLRSFIWDIGTCIPHLILRQLRDNQTALNHVDLTTDLQCGTNRLTQYDVGFGELKSLRTLKWTGINGARQISELKEGLRNNSQKLTTLSIDLVSERYLPELRFDGLNPDADDDAEIYDFAIQCFTKLQPADKKLRLSSLHSLSLTEVRFNEELKDICEALNLDKLFSLKLIRCPGSVALLEEFSGLNLPVQLKSFELAIDPDTDTEEQEMDFTRDISHFIGGFHSLVDLSLVLPAPIDWFQMYRSINHHSSTLKRLVTHMLDDGDDGDYVDKLIPWDQTPHYFHENGNLEFLSESVIPMMPAGLSNRPWKPGCVIFHLRITQYPRYGDKLLDFDDDRSWVTETDEDDDSNNDPNEDLSDDAMEDIEMSGGRQQKHGSSQKLVRPKHGSTWMDGAFSPRAKVESRFGGRDRVDLKFPYGDVRNIARLDAQEAPSTVLGQARFAFSGQKGYPNLKVVAFGDFSHEGRYANDNVLFCKDEDQTSTGIKNPNLAKVRSLRDDGDEELWDIVRKHMPMLTACPISKKMRYDDFDDDEEEDYDSYDDDDDEDDDMDDYEDETPEGWNLEDALGISSDGSDDI